MIEIQRALRELIMAADPRTNMSDIVLIDALSRARNAVNMWISIKEKKPEDRQRCIFWHSWKKRSYFGFFRPAKEDLPDCFDSVIGVVGKYATHWMPEPEGPLTPKE